MKKTLLVLILVLTAALRLIGIFPGYHANHADEVNIYSSAVTMLKEGNFAPYRYEYPPLPDYINLFFYKTVFIPIGWFRFYFSNISGVLDGTLTLNPNPLQYNQWLQLNILGEREINVLFWTRTVTAIFGISIVFLIYKISTNLYGYKAGLISALLVGINYRQVLNSHFGLPDIYNAFFLCIAFLTALRLWKKPTYMNYLIAGIASGLSFSIKYQFFSCFPILLVHLFFVLDKRTWKEKLIKLFDPAFMSAAVVNLLVFLIFNPFLLVNFEIAKDQLTYLALKYRVGKNYLDVYPFWYLYHFGIGKMTSIITLTGIPFIFFGKFKKGLLLFSVTIPFFYATTYATGAGFYVRNFVTITPFLLISGGVFIATLFSIKIKPFKFVSILIGVIFLCLLFIENFSKSYIVDASYIKPWNDQVIKEWIVNNIPKGSKVSAHSSVPLPDYTITRLPFDFGTSFSLQDFISDKSDFAVINTEWVTNEFYYWMSSRDFKTMNKPIKNLESMYDAMMVEELSNYSIYNIIKPGLAPEAGFVVVKVPKFSVKNKELTETFNNITLRNWNSSPIDVTNYKGVVINGDFKNGYLYTNFYSDKSDINDLTKRIGARVSGREMGKELSKKDIVSKIPVGAKWMVVGFSTYSVNDFVVKDISVYNADVEADFGGYNVQKIQIDKDVLFPNSLGNQ